MSTRVEASVAYRSAVTIFQKRKRAEHRFEFLGALQPPTAFDQLITVSAGPEGPVAIWAKEASQDDIQGRYEGPETCGSIMSSSARTTLSGCRRRVGSRYGR